MKTLKLMLVCAFSIVALLACSEKEEPNENQKQNPNQEFDEEYYASTASISSSDSYFTPTDEGGELSFKAEGGEVVISVDCGADWDAESDATDIFGTVCDWDNNTVTVTAGQNTVEEELTGVISLFTAQSHIEFAKITITQNAYGAPEISVETNECSVPAVGELSAEIAVECSIDFQIECYATWLSAVKSAGGITVTAEANEETEERTAEITLSCTDGIRSDSETIIVTQDAKAYVSLSSELMDVLDKGDIATVTVVSNFNWDFSYDSSNGWYSLERGESDELTATLNEDYDGEEDREDTITVTAGDGAANVATGTIRIVQAGQSRALIFVYTTTKASQSVALPLYGEVDCTVNWGDGTSEAIVEQQPTHTYEEIGSYDVKITGKVTQLNSSKNNSGSNSSIYTYLTEVKQWGKTGLTSMERALYNCTSLKTLPGDTAGSFKDVTTFLYAFRACTNLESIPEDLFKYAVNATSFEAAFYGSSSEKALTSVPGKLFENCTKVKEFQHLFYQRGGLTTVPEELFANCPEVENFTQTFGSCKNLESIPEGIFANNTKATDFTSTFASCTSLTTVPEKLFANNTAVTEFSYTFQQSGLTEVPAGLFANNTEVTSFECLFYKCPSLTTVPKDLFANNKKVVYFKQTFDTCKLLAEVPEDLFANNTEVTSFQSIFNGCVALEKIPEGLFANNSNASNFSNAFYGCTLLTEIPGKLFAGCSNNLTLSSTFYNCSGITKIGGENDEVGLFDNCTATTSFEKTFYGCTGLETIPGDLFDKCTEATSFASTFYNCSKLSSNIENLFTYNLKATTFTSTFYGCSGLTCESPYNTVDGAKIHLYERADHTDIFASPTSSSCFKNCTGLSDYENIPSGWK